MDPGKRDSLITFQRGTVSTDDYGGETTSWATLATAWARILYGTGQERREAAQERASQAATFECEWSTELAGVIVTDRILFESEAWDIDSKSPFGHREIHFVAVRST